MRKDKEIAVFGASGQTGKEIINAALSSGVLVRAIVRKDLLMEYSNKVRVLKCDFSNIETIQKTIKDVDGVIIVFGPKPPYTDIFCEKVTKNIIYTMKEIGIKRLICQTGAMIGDYKKNRSLFFEFMSNIFKNQNPNGYKDRVEQEEAIMKSKVDWTIVKPPQLTNSESRKSIKAGENIKVGFLSSISRKSLAQFIIDEFLIPHHIGQAVFVKNLR